jgi:hypothetical protein
MKKLLLILLCLPMIGFGQHLNIRDSAEGIVSTILLFIFLLFFWLIRFIILTLLQPYLTRILLPKDCINKEKYLRNKFKHIKTGKSLKEISLYEKEIPKSLTIGNQKVSKLSINIAQQDVSDKWVINVITFLLILQDGFEKKNWEVFMTYEEGFDDSPIVEDFKLLSISDYELEDEINGIKRRNKYEGKLNETTDFRIKRWKESRALEENRQSQISQDLEVNETTEDTKELEIKSSKTIDFPNELRESTAQEKTSIEYSDTYSLHKNIENFKGKQTEKNKKEVDKQEEIVNTDEITEEKISEKYNSIVDELTKIGKLKEKGLLTEEEFNEQKKKLLNQ